jgi:hypothetical protein
VNTSEDAVAIEKSTDKKYVVFGLYDSRSQIDRAVDMLKMDGFMASDISALLPSREGTQNFAHEKATKAPEGATTGVVGGAALGGTLGWLVGIGALTIPGIGIFVAAGPILATLAGVGIGGSVGGLAGALIGYGIPEYEAKRYEAAVKGGGMLLSVHADTHEALDRVKATFSETGARDVSSTTEAKGDDASVKPADAARLDRPSGDIADGRLY